MRIEKVKWERMKEKESDIREKIRKEKLSWGEKWEESVKWERKWGERK